LHLAETVLAAGTQGARKLGLAHSCLARDHSIADVRTIDTGTVEKTGREHLAGAGFGFELLGGGRSAPDNFPIGVLVGDRAAVQQWTYVGS
jgi:hypothetical protein